MENDARNVSGGVFVIILVGNNDGQGHLDDFCFYYYFCRRSWVLPDKNNV